MKIKTIKIGDIDVPEPARYPLVKGEYYWVVSLNRRVPVMYSWDGDSNDYEFLTDGIVHRTREAAEAHRAAIIKMIGGMP